MSLRLDGLVAALPLALLALAGCNHQGRSGDACEADASALYPSYSCNTGLVCNTGQATPTCESPNAQALDGPCGDSDNCQSGLYCAVSRTCAALLTAGAACPDETGCGSGLVCANVPTPTCVPADASLGTTTDATVGSEAAPGDGGQDATDTDAAPTDAASSGDAACTLADDAGDHGGGCGSAGMCCTGNTPGSTYCYTGDSGTCPALP
jgi:hypothetical protein